MSQTVRIERTTHEILRHLAQQSRRPMPAILRDAVEEYRRQQMIDQAEAAYAALHQDPKAWEQEQAERKLWEGTLADELPVRQSKQVKRVKGAALSKLRRGVGNKSRSYQRA